jgi:hypothetical protein
MSDVVVYTRPGCPFCFNPSLREAVAAMADGSDRP